MHHRFEPTHYFQYVRYTSLGPVHQTGRPVSTTSLDSTGHDASGEQVGAWGNPVTGPFYIEGAEPGDVLVVHLERIIE